ncbi:hypothetical protein D3Z55_21980, partial [Clostridiaceae bacterium]|nr:hypothetical protein [Clostridiaceae bacterium]
MISFNQFVKCMRKEMGKKFQGRLTIKVEKVEKNNGVVITSLLGHLSMIFDAKWQNFCVRKIPMPML